MHDNALPISVQAVLASLVTVRDRLTVDARLAVDAALAAMTRESTHLVFLKLTTSTEVLARADGFYLAPRESERRQARVKHLCFRAGSHAQHKSQMKHSRPCRQLWRQTPRQRY
jgi:hypothetical protein